MLKELNLKATMSYTNEDFREVVEEFIAGQSQFLLMHFHLLSFSKPSIRGS